MNYDFLESYITGTSHAYSFMVHDILSMVTNLSLETILYALTYVSILSIVHNMSILSAVLRVTCY